MRFVTLDHNQANCVFGLVTRTPNTYLQPIKVTSTSMLTSLYVQSMDAGATLVVDYYFKTLGESDGEEIPLGSHKIYSGADSFPDTNTILVNNFHKNVVAKVTLTGGNAVFGVYSSESMASSLDKVIFDGTSINTRPYGLETAARVREVVVTEDWTPLAATPFTRNVIAIQHRDSGKPSDVKINWPPDVLTPVGYVGMVLAFGEERQYDVRNDLVPYARVLSASKAPVTLFVEEVG